MSALTNYSYHCIREEGRDQWGSQIKTFQTIAKDLFQHLTLQFVLIKLYHIRTRMNVIQSRNN